MKFILLYLSGIFLFQYTSGQTAATPVYYTPVTMPASMKNNYYSFFDTRFLAEDLAGLLTQATGKTFTAAVYKPAATKGIFLLLDSNRTYPGNEAGIIEADGENFIRISARYTTGISYAMYSWLEELGFHFYLPGKEWTTVPALGPLLNKKITQKTYNPYFRMRMFTASGGVPVIKGLDEGGDNSREWQLWHVRNRMGCDYIAIGGHIGEAFNIRNKKEIENDSSILAPVNNKRQYSVAGKLDPTYKKGVSLFSNWVVNEFKKSQADWPAFLPFKKYYTADAGDGLNYCHTPACEKQFKTVSDQAFSIVNETARKIKLADPRAGTSTLAYTERADTPTISIEPNVHVMVVATGFQHVTTAAELIKRWAVKSNNVSMYDYLNITASSYDKPFFNIYRYYNTLRFLKSLNIDGITFETSFSKFGSGIQQYFILKFLCDPSVRVDNLLDSFCKDNFGQAASPVKKLFKEWYFSDVHLQTSYDYSFFYEDELGRFIQYISEAENSRGLTAAIKKRIDDLKAYMVYLCKIYELFAELKSLQAYKADPPLRIEKAEELLTYTWQLYDTKIFHNTELNDVLKRLLPDQLKEKWDHRKSEHFKEIRGDITELVKTEFEKVKKKYLPLAVPDYPVTDLFLDASTRFSADSIRITTTDETSVPDFIYPIEFYCAKPGELKINYQTDSSRKKDKEDKVALVSVESADYEFIKTNIIYEEKSSGSIIYQLPAKGHYRLFLSQYNATHVTYVIYPGQNLFYHHKKTIPMNCLLLQDNSAKNYYPNKYLALYAPPADSIYFSNLYIDSKNTTSLYSAAGVSLIVQEGAQPFYNAAAVPKGQENKFLFFSNSQYRLPPVLKNIPPYYFFLKYPLK